MMQFGISSKVSMNDIKAAVKNAQEALKDDGVLMRQIAIFLDQWVQKNFKGQGDKVGGWEPFKYGGRLSLKKKGNAQAVEGHRYVNTSAKLLMDTGALRLSFLPFVRKGTAGIGSDLPYSKPHNEGTDKLVQRRILPEDHEVRMDVKMMMENFVSVKIKRIFR